MRKWGRRSEEVYEELDRRLQKVVDRILHEVADISLTTGYRNKAEQNSKYLSGHSRVCYPYSAHNKIPALAVDFQPHPFPKKKEKLWAALAYVAGAAIGIGKEEGVELRWGGDWNKDGDLTNNRFDDLFHLEIKKGCSNDGKRKR